MAKEKVGMLALPVGLLVLAAVSVATAGPCTYCSSTAPAPPDIPWRDDQVVPGLPTGIAAAPAAAAIGDRFLVAFVSNASGLDQVYLAWSEGIGCTWFPPVLVSTSPIQASRDPALAVTATDLVLVYISEDGFVLARHAPLATWPVLNFGPEEALSTAANGLASNPAVAAVASGITSHVFVAWEGRPAAALGKTRIMFKKSGSGGLAGSFIGADGASPTETDLIEATGQIAFTSLDSGSPVLTADSFGAGSTAVSLGFINDAMATVPGEKHVYFLRSIDSGTTFWGDVTTPPNPIPRKIDDPAGIIAVAIAMDSSDHGLGGSDNWNFAVWADGRRANRDVYSDAQAENGGAFTPPPGPAIARAFGADAFIENGNAQSRDTVAATCAALGPTTPVLGFAYNVSTRMGEPELSFRRLSFDATAGIANACGTGAGSTNTRQLTGQFPAARTAGNAQFPSAADAVVTGPGGPQALQFVTWVDSRSGQDEIWWKSTDLIAPAAPTNVAATPVACDVEGFDVTWDVPADCDVARYIVNFTDPSMVTTTVNVTAPTTTASLVGLIPNTLYTIDVIAVDNACLRSPTTTIQATTSDCPGSIFLVAVQPVLPGDGVDQCSAPGPNGAGNNQVEANEIVRNLKLRIQNTGRGTAANVSATIRPNGAITRGNATSLYPDVGPAGGGNDVQPNVTNYEFHVVATACPMNATNLNLVVDVIAPPQIPATAPVALTYTLVMPGGASCTPCDEDIDLDNAPLDAANDVSDVCAQGGPGNGDHFPDPGETVNLRLPLYNDVNGSTPATNVNVLSITSPNPLVTIVAGASAYPDIQPGTPPPGPPQRNLTDFVITLDPTYDCVAEPDVQLTVQLLADQRVTQQNIGINIPTNPAGCQACGGTSCPVTIPEVTLVQAVKTGLDVVLNWDMLPPTNDGYNVWYVDAKANLPLARRGTGLPTPSCTEPNPALTTTCTHAGARDGAPGTVSYYQVRGLCGVREGQ